MDEVQSKDPNPPEKPYRKILKIGVIIGVIILFLYVLYYGILMFLSAYLLVSDQPLNPFGPEERLVFLNDGKNTRGYFMNNETVFMYGLNTASDNVYLMITGPGIGEYAGANLKYPAHEVINDDPSSFDTVLKVANTSVYGSDSWRYKWNLTSLLPGTYTLYALSQPKDKNHLEGIVYDTETYILR